MINTVRRPFAPLSLAAKKSYRDDDVLKALHEDFRGKCYLTEFLFEDVSAMEVDHFLTQHEADDQLYTWSNLYPIHEKANKQRLKKSPAGGYLDPCDANDDVEHDIIYKVRFDGTVLFRARDEQNTKAVNTAILLTRVHQGIKGAIKNRHHELVNALCEWRHAQQLGNKEDVDRNELLLKSLLSRDSSFTMLMRSIPYIPTEFFD